MKVVFISDIHGIYKYLELLEEKNLIKDCDYFIVLGDIFGPVESNNLKIKQLLKKYENKLLITKGNCDNFTKIDGINLKIEDVKYLKINSKDFYFTHGDVYNCYSNDTFTDGILVYGHEHKPYIKKDIDMIYVNPGSISLPRTEFGPSYGVINDNKITIYEVVSNKVLFTSEF